MRWCDLAFLHWPLPPQMLRPFIPAPLELDTFEAQAWLGIVPFRMEAVRYRYSPPIPTTHAFPELNVRTYVCTPERTGVWFFSLDATSRLAVRAARCVYNLPYFDADIRLQREGEGIRYTSHRTHSQAPPAELQVQYRATGDVYEAAPGTLEHWLVERYCLFAQARSGAVFFVDVHHQPWPLQRAQARVEQNTMAEAAGIELPPQPPLVHFARALDVLAWSRMPVTARSSA
ncbi:DUF2071 domain-containing protein [Rhodocaloribacter litoris]|uniref:YqjF family protein n=1 Tax=Rhodocaloribacter litoris TaxID=2558931 RepID=UPI001E65C5BC|nr:DUF2071 domain-containing protein [Rhodocaloribacter litoris]QXD14414.1 DUF2071 domain-containing protein [Rhodocaloribacter litoris]